MNPGKAVSDMHAYKHFLICVCLTLSCPFHARAQVVIDVSKITCDQFATYKIENPQYIAVWLDGYYHGTRGDMKVDVQTLSADAKKVEYYCLSKPDLPLVEAVKTVLGISVGP
jgi:acid stress chaperone HdeB